MDRADYVYLYSKPDDYKPPDDSELRTNTYYPNLNSKEYRKRPINRTLKIQQFYEAFAISDSGETIFASNSIRSRIWDGSVWGFKQIDDLGIQEKSCFAAHCDSPVTNLCYVKTTLYLLTTANGTIQLWSPKSEVRNVDGYCLFMIGGSNEHCGIILSMDVLSDNTKAVTGTNDCCLKVWDMGADLYSIHTMRYAHSDNITGISAFPDSEPIFVSCSRDKSALIWDYRQLRPAIGLYENHSYAFTSAYWTKTHEKNNQIILGDESGKIYCTDIKMPNKFLSNHQIYKRPIRKIKFYGEHMVVIGNTIMVRAFKFKNDDNLQLVYKDSSSTDLVRDIQWSRWSEKEFYTIGWDSKLRKHAIP